MSRLPADALTEADMTYLLDNFFMVHPDHMIRPYKRYLELYQKRGISIDLAARAAKRFTKRDILDLQCWSNLSWIHPLAFDRDDDLAEFREKGNTGARMKSSGSRRGRWICWPRSCRCIANWPKWTDRADHHAVLPSDPAALIRQAPWRGRRCPTSACRSISEGYREDAEMQIARAVEYHTKLFGEKPGRHVALRGFGLPGDDRRRGQGGHPMDGHGRGNPLGVDRRLGFARWAWLFAQSRDAVPPVVAEDKAHNVQMIFRDHAMSDQIGFHYQRDQADQAVDDFLGKIEAIGRATTANAGHRPTLVSIILDGENCWEYYPNSGVDFLLRPVSPGGVAPAGHARAGPRLPGQASGHGQDRATRSRAVGFSTTSASGSAIPNAIGPGTCCSRRAHAPGPCGA